MDIHPQPYQLLPPAEVRQVDDEGAAHNVGAEAFDQADAGLCRPAGGEKVVDARLEEEHEAKKLLAELESLDVDSKEFTGKLTKLRDAVIAHAEHEEAEEFAKLGTELSQQELERMGEIAKLAEAVAPTRPHPGVESPAANLIVGPFAAMLDRVRDVISSVR